MIIIKKDVERVIYLNDSVVPARLSDDEKRQDNRTGKLSEKIVTAVPIFISERDAGRFMSRYIIYLKNFSLMKKFGIEQVYTHGQAVQKGADRRCAMMLEAKDGWYFLDSGRGISENVMIDQADAPSPQLRAVHGYDPDKEDYTTFFYGFGSGI